MWISTATMKQAQNCFEWNLKLCTFENVASVLAVVYALLGRAVTEYRWGGSRNILFMRHKFLVLTVQKLLKSVYICGSYRKIKTGLSLFLDHSVVYCSSSVINRPTECQPASEDQLVQQCSHRVNYSTNQAALSKIITQLFKGQL